MPITIALGLGISTVSVLALQTVANNSVTLSSQHYSVIAREAAQAGIATCINTLASATDITDNDTRCAATRTVVNDTTNKLTSEYAVGNIVVRPAGSSTLVLSSTGTVKVNGITAATETVQTIAKAGVAGSAGGTMSRQILSISAGLATTCVVAADGLTEVRGSAYCWGSNTDGLLGNGWNYLDNRSRVAVVVPQGAQAAQITTVQNPCDNNIFTTAPTCAPARTSPIAADKKITKISVGTNHVCAVATDGDGSNGRAYCWGNNDSGQLGTRNTTSSILPVAVDTADTVPAQVSTPASRCGGFLQPTCRPEQPASSLFQKSVTDVTAGNGFTCALTSDGLVSCWGRNEYGQLGNDDRTNRTYPTSISYSNSTPQDCIRWGKNWLGQEVCQAYQNRQASALIGKQVKTLAKVKNAATMCVTDTTDAAYCWGQNHTGQLGNGGTAPASATGAGAAGSGNGNACSSIRRTAFKEAVNSLLRYDYDVPRPVAVQSSLKFREITVVSNSADADYLDSIDIGSGTTRTNINQSVTSYVTAMTTGSTNQNRAYYWGGAINFTGYVDCSKNGDTYGGDSSDAKASITRTFSGQTTPGGPLYSSSSGADTGLYQQQLALASGNAYSGLFCAKLLSNSQLYCDRNDDDSNAGQLGNGYSCVPAFLAPCNSQPGTPQRVNTASDNPAGELPLTSAVIAMDTGMGGYTCVVAQASSRNSTYCWGNNSAGQLGDGTTTNRSTPKSVNKDTDSALSITLPASASSPPTIIVRGF